MRVDLPIPVSPTHSMFMSKPRFTHLLTSWSGRESNPTCPCRGSVLPSCPCGGKGFNWLIILESFSVLGGGGGLVYSILGVLQICGTLARGQVSGINLKSPRHTIGFKRKTCV